MEEISLAVESFKKVLSFFRQQENIGFLVSHGFKIDNLENYIPLRGLHRKLVLEFKEGRGEGAKLSYNPKGKFILTIFFYVPPFSSLQKQFLIPNNAYEMFLERKSSYIHEFVHYLDLSKLPKEELEKINVPNMAKDSVLHYNHPYEIRAYTLQALNLILDYIETKLLDKPERIKKEFGTTKEDFIRIVKTKFLNKDFLYYLKPENLKEVDGLLSLFFIKIIEPKLAEEQHSQEKNLIQQMSLNERRKKMFLGY